MRARKSTSGLQYIKCTYKVHVSVMEVYLALSSESIGYLVATLKQLRDIFQTGESHDIHTDMK